MKGLVKKLTFLAIICISIVGCKVDPPVYPAGTLDAGFFKYSLNGGGTTQSVEDGVAFQIVPPGSLDAPQGNIQIYGGTGDQAFTLITTSASTGTFDIAVLIIGNLTATTGSVTITDYNPSADGLSGTIKGTFTADMTDEDGNTYPGVTGSFEVKQ